jgi:hypothetical protein
VREPGATAPDHLGHTSRVQRTATQERERLGRHAPHRRRRVCEQLETAVATFLDLDHAIERGERDRAREIVRERAGVAFAERHERRERIDVALRSRPIEAQRRRPRLRERTRHEVFDQTREATRGIEPVVSQSAQRTAAQAD